MFQKRLGPVVAANSETLGVTERRPHGELLEGSAAHTSVRPAGRTEEKALPARLVF